LRSIKSDILANLEDEALRIGDIAARHRVTPRYVHRLFEREGISYKVRAPAASRTHLSHAVGSAVHRVDHQFRRL
jgi:hypothetical protein